MMQAVESSESLESFETVQSAVVQPVESENVDTFVDTLVVLLVSFVLEPIFMFLVLVVVWSITEFWG